jgi:hypothetical protein
MHYRVLLTAMRQQPFVPFNIVMSNGIKYPIGHPENITIARDSVVIPIYRRNPPGDVADEIVLASYLHIAAIEPLSLSSGNN